MQIERRSIFITGFVLAALLLGRAPQAPAGTVVIDNFDSPTPADLVLTRHEDQRYEVAGSKGLIKGVYPGVIAGEREVLIDVLGPSIPISAAAFVGFDLVSAMGLMQAATFGSTPTAIALTYDGEDEGGMRVDLTDGGENDEFLIRFLSADGGNSPDGLSFAITVSDGLIASALYDDEIADNQNPFELRIKFSDFTVTGGTAPFDRATNVTVVLNATGQRNVDFKLDFIATVPEPSTALLGLLGGAVLSIGWRQRRRLRRS